MAHGRLNRVLDFVRRLASGPGDSAHSDRQLLERFAHQRDEDAFALLVRRHGSLVLSVCRRVLDHEQDAEDAFQAVFLVLARKAESVRWHNDIGNWLYGVACRVARKARGRRPNREIGSAPLLEVAAPTSEDAEWGELRPVLDEEVSRLPEKYRAPVVLCYLKGKTYGEAAHLLGWAEGTVSGRLARARAMLRSRLVRRGLAPSVALLTALPAGTTEAAMPMVMTDAVVRAASAFARERGTMVSGSAVALANEVLRSMMHTKWTIGVAVVLALAATGTTTVILAQRQRPEKQSQVAPVLSKSPAPKVDAARRPALKKEWEGKWDADPFAGTTSIKVVHGRQGGPGRTHHLKEPQTVAALMKQLRIQGFQNDIAQGNKPAAQLTFHKKDGKWFSVYLDSQGTFQCQRGGEIHVDPAFLAALNRHLAGPDGQPTDLTKFLPAPAVKRPAPPAPPTLDTLKAGFKSLNVQYLRGRQLREAHVTDRKILDELEKSLTVLQHEPSKAQKGMPSQSFVAVPKAGVNQHWPHGHFLDREHLFVWDIGLLTVKPAFVETLNEQLSRLEGRKVDVLGENKPPQEQIQREREFRELLSDARSFHYTDAEGREVVIDRREEVAELVKALSLVEVPVRKWELERSGVVIEMTTGKGEKVRLTYFKTGDANEKVDVAPLGGDLVEVSGFGRIWLDRQWRYRFPTYGERRVRETAERRQLETLRSVSGDLPAFVKQVVNLVVSYREGDSELLDYLSADASRPVLEAMEIEKVEKLSWTRKRWQTEMSKLQEKGSGMMELTPGIGFSLPMIFVGEKELLIPMYGRVRLKTDITPKVRQALRNNPDKAKAIQLLPQGPK